MRRILIVLTALLAISAAVGPWAAGAAGVGSAPPTGDFVASDQLPNPLAEKRTELRERAVSEVVSGNLKPEVRNGSVVVKVGETASPSGEGHTGKKKKAQYVELEREKTDRIFVILAEFGNERHPSYPDQDTDPATPGPITFDGPLHNADPAAGPRRGQLHGLAGGLRPAALPGPLLRRRRVAEELLRGAVVGPLQRQRNGHRLGRACSSTRRGTAAPTASRARASSAPTPGRSSATPPTSGTPTSSLRAARPPRSRRSCRPSTSGTATTTTATATSTSRTATSTTSRSCTPAATRPTATRSTARTPIWSHRWYANQIFNGTVGPPQNPLGGFQVGSSGFWIGDYTIQPENGGRSVFYHEYGHDLGLPDDYNIICGGDNNNEHWTLMAQSRLGAKDDQGIGERGGDLGAWNKLQLGWLNAAVLQSNEKKTLELGPQEYNSKNPQALVVVLPKKTVVTDLGAPAAGANQFYSGDGDDLDNTLTRQVSVPAGSASLTFKARWDIEDCGPDPCDYAFVEVDNGTGFTAIAGSIANAAEGNGIDGVSAGWTDATFDLSGVRRQDGRTAVPLRHGRRRRRERRHAAQRHLRRRHRHHRRLHRWCRERAG